MKDPIRFVRKGILDALVGNVELDSVVVPVHGRVPSNATFPYIRVYSVETNEVDNNRDSYNTEVITRIEVNTRFDSDTGGELNCNIITDKIAQIVRTRSGGYVDLGSNGFKIYTSEIESISYVEDDMNDKTYFRSIMELSNRVFQQ